MAKAVVIKDHAPLHEDVLVARKGEVLRPGRTDDEWPGWTWCVSQSGVGSWVPEPYLSREGDQARLLVDYDATELVVAPGDTLMLHHEVNGWWWVTAEDGRRGWVPAEKITQPSEAA